ncbi:hypothetical protein HBI56_141140 [Parastagonospora nodorum]|nr:hypothetical protein HBH56_126690 [Parastagonospora nodorum]KAH3931620.1 hypothetical protein HBH54_096810 [Parastagonospora nodorum]KAH3947246.1 hypothetical protein HBH53_116950 [Parastagonospora nodorum]KAH3970783.1 hypothetical protein HBH51_113400 [Parastagonospora nodorum]KAH3971634.1 hypothetical protein HBH52_155690 [Parastagonospora nodorum]
MATPPSLEMTLPADDRRNPPYYELAAGYDGTNSFLQLWYYNHDKSGKRRVMK